ncbi:MAG: tripartite tricarboxylate transporter substrate binding protein [Xanthobacteraceae bacterium]|nr:tripartite tricarboxylate transporter substrate binding protein [Xanthobacteraceae bacterium]MBV9629193.1 tripartite tricarboxylate transporter substrate binding protein [Xanthobacteraceae bacterium]
MRRREVIAGLAGAAAWPLLARAQEQDYPTRQITLIAPWPAGGSIDALCRALTPGMGDRLGKPVVVENRAGAGSTIGTAACAKAAPDGYTLVMAGSGSLAISPTLYKKLPYDPAKDFAPVKLAAYVPFMLVLHPSVPAHSVAELVSYAKSNPGKLSYASGGPGSPHHLYAELFKTLTGIEMLHVPYKGNAPALTDVMAGHVSLMFSDPVVALPQVRAGKLLALGVTSAKRIPSASDIPPLAEVGVPSFNTAGWGMIVAPAHTAGPIVARLHAALDDILTESDVQEQISNLGMIPAPNQPSAELQSFIDSEMVRWGKVVQQAGLAGSE